MQILRSNVFDPFGLSAATAFFFLLTFFFIGWIDKKSKWNSHMLTVIKNERKSENIQKEMIKSPIKLSKSNNKGTVLFNAKKNKKNTYHNSQHVLSTLKEKPSSLLEENRKAFEEMCKLEEKRIQQQAEAIKNLSKQKFNSKLKSIPKRRIAASASRKEGMNETSKSIKNVFRRDRSWSDSDAKLWSSYLLVNLIPNKPEDCRMDCEFSQDEHLQKIVQEILSC